MQLTLDLTEEISAGMLYMKIDTLLIKLLLDKIGIMNIFKIIVKCIFGKYLFISI